MIEDVYADGAVSDADDDGEARASPKAAAEAVTEDQVDWARNQFSANCPYLTGFEFEEGKVTFKLEVGGRGAFLQHGGD
jgi:hypothetical protein